MRVQQYKVELKDVSITPFTESRQPKSLKDVMYLYYTLEITDVDRNKTIAFTAHDFPCIDKLSQALEDVDKADTVNIGSAEYMVWDSRPTFGYEHGMRLEKTKSEHMDSFVYDLTIYEEFGNIVQFSLMSREDIVEIAEYIDGEIQGVIDGYKTYMDDEE